jgi:hypothetical protein
MEMANQMLAEIKAATRRKTSDKKEMLPPIPKSDELSSHVSQMNLAPKTPPAMYHEPPQHPITTLPQRVEPSIDPAQQELINQQLQQQQILHQQHLQQLQEATKITAQVQVKDKSQCCVFICLLIANFLCFAIDSATYKT